MQDGIENNVKVMPERIEKQYEISVVIPVYNREKTIKRCIDSVVNQTYPVFEIIMVDDGSTDKTLDIVKEEYGDKITIIRQKHKGAQAARNAGIRAAQGKYIGFLDSDDEWMPNKIELQVQELQKNGDVVVCGDGYTQMDWGKNVPLVYRRTGNIGKNSRMGVRSPLRMNGISGNIYETALEKTFGDFDSLLAPKKSLVDIGYLDEKVPSFQEWDVVIRLAEKNRFVYIKKPLYVYHLHDGDTISKNSEKIIAGKEYIVKKYTQEMIRIHGLQGLNTHYKNLFRLAVKYRSKKAFVFVIKILHISILDVAGKLRKAVLIKWKQKNVVK